MAWGICTRWQYLAAIIVFKPLTSAWVRDKCRARLVWCASVHFITDSKEQAMRATALPENKLHHTPVTAPLCRGGLIYHHYYQTLMKQADTTLVVYDPRHIILIQVK